MAEQSADRVTFYSLSHSTALFLPSCPRSLAVVSLDFVAPFASQAFADLQLCSQVQFEAR